MVNNFTIFQNGAFLHSLGRLLSIRNFASGVIYCDRERQLCPELRPLASKEPVLMLIVEKYEEEHYAISAPDPIEAIKFLMEQTACRAKIWSLTSGQVDVCLRC